MAICKSFSVIKMAYACNEEKQIQKSSRVPKATTVLSVICFGICACILILYVQTTYQVHNLMEQVSNLSIRLQNAEKYQWNNTDALLYFERMLNETKGDGVIEYPRHAQINREGQGLKRFLTGFSNMELLNKNFDSGVTAVHYIPHEYKDISRNRSIKCSGSCCHVWSGIFCANQTFLLNDPLHGVQFFTPSPWMKSEHIEEVKPLVQSQTDTSSFSVTKSGLHLLYLNILVQATKSSHDIAIYIDGVRKLDCRESLDYVRSDLSNPYMFSKGKTCSVSAVFFLQQRSDLSIRVLTSQTAVILKPFVIDYTTLSRVIWLTGILRIGDLVPVTAQEVLPIFPGKISGYFGLVYFVWSAYEISTLKSEVKDLSKVVASISPGGKTVSKSYFL